MLFPKEKNFFNLFEAQAEKLVAAENLLQKLISQPEDIEAIAKEMKIIEHEADQIGHRAAESLHKAFITPIEREDINLLRQNLDDVMDGIERATNRLAIYNINLDQNFLNKLTPYFEIICKAIEEIQKGIYEIKNFKKFSKDILSRCEKINSLENEGDELNRKTLKNLMNPSGPLTPERALDIVKEKEIFETLEDVIDCCEDVANVLEGILIKNL